MQRIRKRTRLDTLVNQRRVVSPLSWSRWIYLGLVAALALFLGNYVVGDAVLLRADGIVLTDRHISASTYPAKVRRVNVREGQQVQVGTALLRDGIGRDAQRHFGPCRPDFGPVNSRSGGCTCLVS